MAISYPLSLPSVKGLSGIIIRGRSAAGMSVSPFTFAQQVYVYPGDAWEADVALPPMLRADAEEWVSFLLSLNGREGTFLMGDPVNISPRGTWAGSPLVNGNHAAGIKTVAFDGFSAGATGKAGDWLQFGSGATSRLHKVVQDFTADGAGTADVEIWPSLRDDVADNDAALTSSPKGVWRLASNVSEYSIEIGQVYGFGFKAIEAI